MNGNNSKTVFVAISGGVDSSVAAALLKEQGFEVVGVYMKCWSDDQTAVIEGTRPWKKDAEDARQVSKQLDIPFKIFDFEREYREKVMDYFFSEYKQGRTPNPDVECNREIKFGLFLEESLSQGADFIATGHYVKSEVNLPQKKEFLSSLEAVVNGVPLKKDDMILTRGDDDKKDQSYFLWPLGQEELQYSLFPIGFYNKFQVRQMARKRKLATHGKPDSHGICFVGEVDVQDFLRKNIGTNEGPIVDHTGKKMGTHEGLWMYTLGQRQGLGLQTNKPYYVAERNVSSNELVVVPQELEEKYLYDHQLTVAEINWGRETPSFPLSCQAQIRYLQPPQLCRVIQESTNSLRVIFDEPQRAITPGQSIVFYDGKEVLGGGVIMSGINATIF